MNRKSREKVEALANFRKTSGVDTRKPREQRRTSAYATARAVPVPPLTPALASAFVKITAAGVPSEIAVAYCVPDLPEPTRRETLAVWLNDPMLIRAAVEYRGGEWQDLEPDRRLELALDQHFAQLAYYLYSHNFATAEGIDLAKLTDARKALSEKLKGASEGEDTPYMLAMRDLIAGNLGLGTPPTLEVGKAIPVPRRQES